MSVELQGRGRWRTIQNNLPRNGTRMIMDPQRINHHEVDLMEMEIKVMAQQRGPRINLTIMNVNAIALDNANNLDATNVMVLAILQKIVLALPEANEESTLFRTLQGGSSSN